LPDYWFCVAQARGGVFIVASPLLVVKVAVVAAFFDFSTQNTAPKKDGRNIAE